MRVHRYFAIAILLAPLVAAAACGGATDDTSPRQPNNPYPSATHAISPETEMGPSPQNMPGGGRGSDPPHSKGKP